MKRAQIFNLRDIRAFVLEQKLLKNIVCRGTSFECPALFNTKVPVQYMQSGEYYNCEKLTGNILAIFYCNESLLKAVECRMASFAYLAA